MQTHKSQDRKGALPYQNQEYQPHWSVVYNQTIENRGTPSAMHRQIGNREFPGVRANAK